MWTRFSWLLLFHFLLRGQVHQPSLISEFGKASRQIRFFFGYPIRYSEMRNRKYFRHWQLSLVYTLENVLYENRTAVGYPKCFFCFLWRLAYNLPRVPYSVKIKVFDATTGTKATYYIWFSCTLKLRSLFSRFTNRIASYVLTVWQSQRNICWN